MARERPAASNVPRPRLTGLDDGIRDTDKLRLTRAQAHALRRSAPLTHAKLQEHFKVLLASDPRVADAQDSDASHVRRSPMRPATAMSVAARALASAELASPVSRRCLVDHPAGGPPLP